MSHLEELFEQARNDPDTHVSKESVESWLNTLGENADHYHYLENKTIEIIRQEKEEILREFPVDTEKWETSLSMYRYINDLQDLRLGYHIRWIREKPDCTYSLTNGGILVQIKFLKNGTYLLCKNGGQIMQYELEKCKTFQKISAEEWMFLMANGASVSV